MLFCLSNVESIAAFRYMNRKRHTMFCKGILKPDSRIFFAYRYGRQTITCDVWQPMFFLKFLNELMKLKFG